MVHKVGKSMENVGLEANILSQDPELAQPIGRGLGTMMIGLALGL